MMARFAESGFEPVEIDGRLVHPMLRLRPKAGDCVVLSWLGANSPRVQGVALRLRRQGVPGARGYGGVLSVADTKSAALMLWMDSSPAIVSVEVVEVADDVELQLSNRWRQDDGREDEWLNNFGMLIEPEGGDSFIVRCSDGYGHELNMSFDDLIVGVKLIRA